MLYDVRIEGETALIQHSSDGLIPGNAVTKEIDAITSKRGTNRTESDNARLQQLETLNSLWRERDTVTIPAQAIRACIEQAARKSREGPAVREGLVVLETTFTYDVDRYGETLDQLMDSTQFQSVVVVQRNKIVRTRAKFDPPWSVDIVLDCDEELVDQEKLHSWFDIAGRRIGLGDWRPSKSGTYGRFVTAEISARPNAD